MGFVPRADLFGSMVWMSYLHDQLRLDSRRWRVASVYYTPRLGSVSVDFHCVCVGLVASGFLRWHCLCAMVHISRYTLC